MNRSVSIVVTQIGSTRNEESKYRARSPVSVARLDVAISVAALSIGRESKLRPAQSADHCIEIAARGKETSFTAHHEPAVQLRQFLDGSAETEISDVP
jgi:hypothetical protein